MTSICKNGCQTPIKFDNSRISANSRMIPLNLDDTLHDCPKKLSYNKRTIRCKYCNEQITFDNNIKSKSGKKIPLNLDRSYHNCPKSPFNLSKTYVLDKKQNGTVKLSIDDNSSCQLPQVIKDN